MGSSMAPTEPREAVLLTGHSPTEITTGYPDGRPMVPFNNQLIGVTPVFHEHISPVPSGVHSQQLSPVLNGYASSTSSTDYDTPTGAGSFMTPLGAGSFMPHGYPPIPPCTAMTTMPGIAPTMAMSTQYPPPAMSNGDYISQQPATTVNVYQPTIVAAPPPGNIGALSQLGYVPRACVPLYQVPPTTRMVYPGNPVHAPPANYVQYYSRPMAIDVSLPPPMYRPAIQSGIPLPGGATYLKSSDPSLTKHLDKVWHAHFDYWVTGFRPDVWRLEPKLELPSGDDGWTDFEDEVKVRFSCSGCGNAWTSMKGLVMFRFRLTESSHGGPRVGEVHFRLLGQMCKKCQNGRTEGPLWYPEEVVKVVQNVCMRVGHHYYGLPEQQLREERRKGKPRGQHNTELCAACLEGHCRRSNNNSH